MGDGDQSPSHKGKAHRRRPMGFFGPFNKWWSDFFATNSRRPSKVDIEQWRNQNPDWRPELSLEDIVAHSKGRRDPERNRQYFVEYRRKLKAAANKPLDKAPHPRRKASARAQRYADDTEDEHEEEMEDDDDCQDDERMQEETADEEPPAAPPMPTAARTEAVQDPPKGLHQCYGADAVAGMDLELAYTSQPISCLGALSQLALVQAPCPSRTPPLPPGHDAAHPSAVSHSYAAGGALAPLQGPDGVGAPYYCDARPLSMPQLPPGCPSLGLPWEALQGPAATGMSLLASGAPMMIPVRRARGPRLMTLLRQRHAPGSANSLDGFRQHEAERGGNPFSCQAGGSGVSDEDEGSCGGSLAAGPLASEPGASLARVATEPHSMAVAVAGGMAADHSRNPDSGGYARVLDAAGVGLLPEVPWPPPCGGGEGSRALERPDWSAAAAAWAAGARETQFVAPPCQPPPWPQCWSMAPHPPPQQPSVGLGLSTHAVQPLTLPGAPVAGLVSEPVGPQAATLPAARLGELGEGSPSGFGDGAMPLQLGAAPHVTGICIRRTSPGPSLAGRLAASRAPPSLPPLRVTIPRSGPTPPPLAGPAAATAMGACAAVSAAGADGISPAASAAEAFRALEIPAKRQRVDFNMVKSSSAMQPGVHATVQQPPHHHQQRQHHQQQQQTQQRQKQTHPEDSSEATTSTSPCSPAHGIDALYGADLGLDAPGGGFLFGCLDAMEAEVADEGWLDSLLVDADFQTGVHDVLPAPHHHQHQQDQPQGAQHMPPQPVLQQHQQQVPPYAHHQQQHQYFHHQQQQQMVQPPQRPQCPQYQPVHQQAHGGVMGCVARRPAGGGKGAEAGAAGEVVGGCGFEWDRLMGGAADAVCFVGW